VDGREGGVRGGSGKEQGRGRVRGGGSCGADAIGEKGEIEMGQIVRAERRLCELRGDCASLCTRVKAAQPWMGLGALLCASS